MPLDTSIYALSHLRLDGRRWNELRRIHASISTQAAADGSSYLEMGNTKVICTVSGPAEGERRGGRGGGGGGGDDDKATVLVEVSVAGFSGVDRKRRVGGDRRLTELSTTISSTFSSTLLTNLFPRSTISISLHVLAQDGALLAACLNASTLALVDAGIPMMDYVVACSAGSISTIVANGSGGAQQGGADDGLSSDPLLDLNTTEEQELPFLTAATLGDGDKVVVLVMESKVHVSRVEGMLAVAVDGCKQVRQILDRLVRAQGKRLLAGAVKS